MKTLSLKHFSFLSIALIVVSAVTAAIIPIKEEDSYDLKYGTILPSSDGASLTCKTRFTADSCFVTSNSGTTGHFYFTSDGTTYPDDY